MTSTMSEPKRIKLSELLPDRHNANAGTERGQYMVDTSIEQFGAGRSILLDRDNEVIAGNKTLQALIDAGYDELLVVESDGKTAVAVKRTDMDLDDPSTGARGLAYADNRASEVGLAWDAQQLLADVQAGIDLETWFHEDELTALLEGLVVPEEPTPDPGAQVDRAEELNTVWQVERGQIWEVPSLSVAGKAHRVMCGDSTSEDDVKALLDGNKPRLMVTDPPYGVEYDASWRDEAAEKGLLQFAKRRTAKVMNDHEVNWEAVWQLSPSEVFYCWHADLHASEVQQTIESAGFNIRAQIIWSKPHFVIGRGHYNTRHEPCWYAVKKNCNADWLGEANEVSVWEITLDKNIDGGHSTQKPLECMARPIRNHAGDVYEPFLGSGTTLVACEQLGRVGYGMEIEPKYVAVTLQRLADMGLEPRLIHKNLQD